MEKSIKDTKKKRNKDSDLNIESNERKYNNKRLLIIVASILLLLPTVISLFLIIKVEKLEKKICQDNENAGSVKVVEDNKYSSSDYENIEIISNTENDSMVNEITNDSAGETAIDNGNNPGYQEYDGIIKVCLTFDDGPSPNTDAILDILNDYGIKATFFVNGHEGYEEQLKRIVNDGHSLGMHSYSHSYRLLYRNLDAFADDLYEIQTYLYNVTGTNSTIYRFPGGSSNKVSNVDMKSCISYLRAKGIEYYDWNVSADDAIVGGASVNAIVNNVMNEVYALETDTIVILLHDTGDKKTTVEALPIIIEKLADMENVAFVPITEDVVPVHHIEVNE